MAIKNTAWELAINIIVTNYRYENNFISAWRLNTGSRDRAPNKHKMPFTL